MPQIFPLLIRNIVLSRIMKFSQHQKHLIILMLYCSLNKIIRWVDVLNRFPKVDGYGTIILLNVIQFDVSLEEQYYYSTSGSDDPPLEQGEEADRSIVKGLCFPFDIDFRSWVPSPPSPSAQTLHLTNFSPKSSL